MSNQNSNVATIQHLYEAEKRERIRLENLVLEYKQEVETLKSLLLQQAQQQQQQDSSSEVSSTQRTTTDSSAHQIKEEQTPTFVAPPFKMAPTSIRPPNTISSPSADNSSE